MRLKSDEIFKANICVSEDYHNTEASPVQKKWGVKCNRENAIETVPFQGLQALGAPASSAQIQLHPETN
jgi:hypothetical protein